MCGRYSLAGDQEQINYRFSIDLEDYRPRYNIAPSQPILTIIKEKTFRMFSWGLIPYWSKDPKKILINARGETINQKPSFRKSFRTRRCLIPADGFFEWGPNKTPYRFQLSSQKIFAMAGIWDIWVSPLKEEFHTCSIITCQANELVGKIHNRMPVILPLEKENLWLEPNEPEILSAFLQPYCSEDMVAYPVSKIVNSANNDLKECLINIEQGRS